ncbi:MAG TPA: 2-oxoglutarate dehydrogenase, E2 component, dihydrolipoamide succinyltransferase [Mycobacteriales bacterium]|jgi:2-oxoglutarate dehydrogenase E2 component (dihydrolipoamide succinyltransferase)|nr:2-oxoglutarate dehydrogenase, E2 component, dihydrolipoamide succinyltransferase [Mycobacteriales bacterium]
MSVSVKMPQLGESVSEGTVTRWLKAEGEQVAADEPLLEVSTDKVDTEIPSPASGVLTSIKVAEDETVDVGVELAIIDEAGTATAAPAAEAPATEAPTAETPAAEAPAPKPAPPAAAASPPPAPAAPAPAAASAPAAAAAPVADDEGDDDGQGASYVTPLVRRLAAEHNVDLTVISGTGVGGRIRKQDVLDAAAKGGAAAATAPAAPAAQAPAPAVTAAPVSRPVAAPPADARPGRTLTSPMRGSTEKLSRLRTVIAERMTESLRISAQLTTVVEVDLTKIARLRTRAKAEFEGREGVKLTYLPFFAIAVCEALREHPEVNASIDLEAGTVTYHDTVHLGVAVDTDRGLLVPVLKEASDLNLAGIARKVDDLARRTRDNRITPDELGGGTFTITNTGSRGALFDTPIINQPQVGILGTGAVVKRPVVIDDPVAGEVIAIRNICYLALTYDHRMVDGADAARFLGTVKARLEAGEFESELAL